MNILCKHLPNESLTHKCYRGLTMCPVLPIILMLLGATNSASTPVPAEGSAGLEFVLAFPENIAYYYPSPPTNMVQITGLQNSTNVTIDQQGFSTSNHMLSAGQSTDLILDARLEFQRCSSPKRIVRINSNSPVLVNAIYLKNNSVQTALVLPTNRLATEYFVPPVPDIEGTTLSLDIFTLNVTERSPFQLTIINGKHQNTINLTGGDTSVSLEPHQVYQTWVHKGDALRSLKANQPIAVLFGHTCAIRINCTCGHLMASLPPATDDLQKFYIPSGLLGGTKGSVLVSNRDKSEIKAFTADWLLVETAGTVILYRPGLLLTLIPEKDFAGCYMVNAIPDAQCFFHVVVHKDHSDGVHVGSLLLENPKWEAINGTDYISAIVPLEQNKIVWHSSSPMAVYFVGEKKGAWFGNPAAVLDSRGCALSPDVVEIGEVATGWRESLKYCRDQNLRLASLPGDHHQRIIHEKIIRATNGSLGEVWIGMRRSSQSGEWYWLNGAPVADTNWGEGEPRAVGEGQCAMMSLKINKSFGWSNRPCCEAARPFCYREPVLFPL
ncbi:IgGFc-binding protein-like isoform 2-T2 [Spinachia spinachia]